MGELRESIIRLLEKKPGLSDREITDEIRGRRALPQSVNQACNSLESQSIIFREKREDGIIGNYLTGKNPLLYQRQRPQRPQDIWRGCAFCDGTGQDPGDGNPMRGLCRVCKGNKGAYLLKDWRRCRGECGGRGRIPREPVGPFPNYRQCRDCNGIGWANPSRFE